jgi:hypothetical protein
MIYDAAIFSSFCLLVFQPPLALVTSAILPCHSKMANFPELPAVSYPNQLDDRHQGQKVTIIAALCLCFSAVVLATRLMIRWPWPRLFGLDDSAAIAASVRTFNTS